MSTQIEALYHDFLANNPYPRKLTHYELHPAHFSSAYLMRDGKTYLNFSSSDYLGLAKHPLLLERSRAFAEQWGVGGTASRLVVGNFALYDALEQKLATALQKPAALLLSSGYLTNHAVLEALLDRRVLGEKPRVFCDKLCHASLLSPLNPHVELHRFRHNDLTQLRTLLEKYAAEPRPQFIVVESLYSMDGDQADLTTLCQLAKTYGAFLYVDDAHSVGVYGREGFGLASDYADHIDIIMGTFSKGLGSAGGYVGCSEVLRHYLINKCRGLIYSTGMSPTVLGAIDAALDIVPTMTTARQHVIQSAHVVRAALQQQGLNTGHSTTHIVPWIVGEAERTLHVSAALEAEGILGATIRPPSVAIGQSRIRFCLTAEHTTAAVETLCAAIAKIGPIFGVL